MSVTTQSHARHPFIRENKGIAIYQPGYFEVDNDAYIQEFYLLLDFFRRYNL